MFVNLLAVHWSNRKADKAVGKNTMVVKLGKNTKTVHAVFTGFIYLIFALLVFLVPLNVIIVTFLTIPIALWSIINFEKRPMSSSFLMSSVMIFASIGFIIS